MRDLAGAQAGGGPYTTRQIDAALSSAAATVGARFDVLDRTGAPTPIVLNTVLDAKCDWDATRTIRKSLSLKLLPVAGLLGKPFQYTIRAWFQIGMPDGGLCELNMGYFLWVEPQRTIQMVGALGNTEVWDVSLGDRQHLLDIQGPTLAGTTVTGNVAAAIKALLAFAGVTDFSRVSNANTAITTPLSYGTSPTPFGVVSSIVDPVAALRDHIVALYDVLRTVVPASAVPPAPPSAAAIFSAAGSTTPTTIAKILDDVMFEFGYNPGYFDANDRFVAQLVPNLATTPATISYTAETVLHPSGAAPGARLDLVKGNASVSTAMDQIANVVYVRANHTAATYTSSQKDTTSTMPCFLSAPTGTNQITLLNPNPPGGLRSFPSSALQKDLTGPDLNPGTKLVSVTANTGVANSQGTMNQNSKDGLSVDLPGVHSSTVTFVSGTTNVSVPSGSVDYQTVDATLDLDVYMPAHPLARNRVGYAIPATIDVTSTNAQDVLIAAGKAELLRRALSYKTVTLDTLAYPGHEGHEIVALTVPGDSEYATPQLHLEVGWSIDLLRGTQAHQLKRIFQ